MEFTDASAGKNLGALNLAIQAIQLNGGTLRPLASTAIVNNVRINAISTVDVGNSLNLSFTAAVANATGNGLTGMPGGLQKQGTGTLTIGGTGNNAGLGIQVQQGMLNLAKATSPTIFAVDQAIGAALIIESGATAALGTGGTGGGLATTAAVTLGGGANSEKLILGDATGAVDTTLAGLIVSGSGTQNRVVGGNAIFSTLTINNASLVTFAGILGGGGANENNLNLVKNGVGTLELTGLNTFTGTTTVNAGTLSVSNPLAGTVYVNGGTFSGAGAAGSSVVVQGGTQTVTGTQSGSTTVSSGTTNVASGGSITGALTQTGGATNIQSGGSTTGAVTVSGGLFTVQNGGAASSTPGIDVNLGGQFVVQSGGSVGGNG